MPFILQCWISNVAAAGSWGATFFHTDVGYPTLTAADGWGATSFIRTMLDIQPGSPRSNGAATAPFRRAVSQHRFTPNWQIAERLLACQSLFHDQTRSISMGSRILIGLGGLGLI